MFDSHPAGRKQQPRTAAWLGKMDAHILHTNGANFNNTREDSHWRQPAAMLLNAWTQTTGEDFELLRSLDNDPQLHAENRALRDKVRYLESKLQQHTDLLSQIHATSARMQLATNGVGAGLSLSPTHQQQQQPQPQLLTPPSSVICAPSSKQLQQQQQQQRPEVIDYKIIAAAGADCGDADAIEIRLAAESLNSLSTSADSDRLEICLEEQQIKREVNTPLQLIKRRKLEQQSPQQQQHSPQQQQLQLQQQQQQHLLLQHQQQQQQQQHLPLQHQQQQQQHLHNLQYKLPTRRSNPSKIKEEQLSDNVMVSIGPNNTCVPACVFENINWSVSSLATRKLLVAIFDRETLATHSMTGKPSPAFKDQHKPLKEMLDPLKIQDIIFAVTRKSNASEKEVRNAITTKCADENKMMKIQKGKRCSIGDKENMLNCT